MTETTGTTPGDADPSGDDASTQTPPAATQPVETGVSEAAPVTPAYSVVPDTEVDPPGDATAEFTATDAGEQRDQMPSEFGARGTNASGNRPEDDRPDDDRSR